MKRMIHCSCGYKFEVGARSKATMCFNCIQKNVRKARPKPTKILDVACEKIDRLIAQERKTKE